MACGCNGAITNQGARLIDRARNEGKSIVFSGVRMNTVYENDLMSLVQKPETWFSENVGEVVGCLSHIIIDDVSHVCDAKVAVQCNDNSKAWKTIGIYGHLEGESNDTLIYCESIQNGDFKGTTVVELPVTLDGAVDDFGLSEGEGGGGGSDVPANMMTTDTDQSGLSGVKTWELQSYIGDASADNPDIYDLLNVSRADIGNLSYYNVEGRPVSYPIELSNTQQIRDEYGWTPGQPSYAKLSPLGVLQLNSGDKVDEESHVFSGGESVEITPNGIQYQNPGAEISNATWANIINAANRPAPSTPVILSGSEIVGTELGDIGLWEELIPASGSLTHDGIVFDFDASKQLASVRSAEGIAAISVRVFDNFSSGNEVGIVNGVCDSTNGLSFETSVALAKNYLFMWSIVKA